ncbi:hypothetical protein BGZ51_006099 [Haplosporangium sp. Z 767]|nr:hypothetical protein BGZ51_006099 [Haplosporangium sp. Z 767]KAF9186243.1 hypothetical protein BGZ50_002572 [Haplosporangium sp. Z 11]
MDINQRSTAASSEGAPLSMSNGETTRRSHSPPPPPQQQDEDQEQQQRNLSAYLRFLNDSQEASSSDSDASSDSSSFSGSDVYRREYSHDLNDLDFPLAGPWNMTAQWHLGDYSEGVEGDADDADDDEDDQGSLDPAAGADGTSSGSGSGSQLTIESDRLQDVNSSSALVQGSSRIGPHRTLTLPYPPSSPTNRQTSPRYHRHHHSFTHQNQNSPENNVTSTAGSSNASATNAPPSSPVDRSRLRRVVSSNISSLPSFASSIFTPRAYGTGGYDGPAGLHRDYKYNNAQRQCCFLQPGQKFHGKQDLKSMTVTLPGMQSRHLEEWDVKVTISAVDYDAGMVYGLMEAMDVPMSTSNVVTFWEGEIIDFVNHTFWTRKWAAKARTDLEHWKRLEAFNGVDEKYIIRGAKTGKFRGHIQQKYIFMRWKEKHFVNVSEHTSGLTIAGFYYVSMRRADGIVEGYYHDQQSMPFQHLCLSPTFDAGGFSSSNYELA